MKTNTGTIAAWIDRMSEDELAVLREAVRRAKRTKRAKALSVVELAKLVLEGQTFRNGHTGSHAP